MNSKDYSKWDKKIAMLCHCIIATTRPNSFISPLLLGISSYLHIKHASKNLIDVLAHVGVCASYAETLRFQSSIVRNPQNYEFENSYIQTVFDNADFNTDTIDGKNTFHAMGSIICATPSSLVQTNKTIERLKVIPSAQDTSEISFIKLKPFKKYNELGLKMIEIENFSFENQLLAKINFTNSDFLWFYSKKIKPTETPGWNGFMELCTEEKEYETSKIIPVPFIRAPPSDRDTIVTAMTEAEKKRKILGQL